jgi:DUF1009 family protein
MIFKSGDILISTWEGSILNVGDIGIIIRVYSDHYIYDWVMLSGKLIEKNCEFLIRFDWFAGKIPWDLLTEERKARLI